MRALGRTAAALSLAALLEGCGVPGGPPLVSAQTPPNQSSNSEPQPLGSLPPGAAVAGAGPNAAFPDFFSYTFGRRS